MELCMQDKPILAIGKVTTTFKQKKLVKTDQESVNSFDVKKEKTRSAIEDKKALGLFDLEDQA